MMVKSMKNCLFYTYQQNNCVNAVYINTRIVYVHPPYKCKTWPYYRNFFIVT